MSVYKLKPNFGLVLLEASCLKTDQKTNKHTFTRAFPQKKHCMARMSVETFDTKWSQQSTCS